MESEEGPPWPEKYAIPPGTVFPVYRVFAALAGFRRHAPLQCSHPSQASGLALFGPDGKRRILLGNLTADRLPIAFCPTSTADIGLERLVTNARNTGARTDRKPAVPRRSEVGSGNRSWMELVLEPYEVGIWVSTSALERDQAK